MNTQTQLHTLPVLPYQSEDGMMRAYTKELAKVRNRAQLRAHVRRWKHLWQLKPMNWVENLNREEIELGLGRVHKHVFKKLLRFRDKHDPTDNPGRMSKIAMNIMLPRALLNAYLLANKYQAPFDVAMIQMYAPNYSW